MSITLSIPPAIVQEVREWAEANGTSLNQYVRDCLAAKAQEIEQQWRSRGQILRMRRRGGASTGSATESAIWRRSDEVLRYEHSPVFGDGSGSP